MPALEPPLPLSLLTLLACCIPGSSTPSTSSSAPASVSACEEGYSSKSTSVGWKGTRKEEIEDFTKRIIEVDRTRLSSFRVDVETPPDPGECPTSAAKKYNADWMRAVESKVQAAWSSHEKAVNANPSQQVGHRVPCLVDDLVSLELRYGCTDGTTWRTEAYVCSMFEKPMVYQYEATFSCRLEQDVVDRLLPTPYPEWYPVNTSSYGLAVSQTFTGKSERDAAAAQLRGIQRGAIVSAQAKGRILKGGRWTYYGDAGFALEWNEPCCCLVDSECKDPG